VSVWRSLRWREQHSSGQSGSKDWPYLLTAESVHAVTAMQGSLERGGGLSETIPECSGVEVSHLCDRSLDFIGRLGKHDPLSYSIAIHRLKVAIN